MDAISSVLVQQRLLLPLSLHHAVYVVSSVCRDVTSLHFLEYSYTQNDRLILVVCSIGLDTGTKFAVCVKAVRQLLACTSDGLSTMTFSLFLG